MIGGKLSLPEIRREGLRALLERLGPGGTLRFLQQFDPGQGDYTAERAQWLEGMTIEEILSGARARGTSDQPD